MVSHRHRIGSGNQSCQVFAIDLTGRDNSAVSSNPGIYVGFCTTRYIQGDGSVAATVAGDIGSKYTDNDIGSFGNNKIGSCCALISILYGYGIGANRQTADILCGCSVRPGVGISSRSTAYINIYSTGGISMTNYIGNSTRNCDGCGLCYGCTGLCGTAVGIGYGY